MSKVIIINFQNTKIKYKTLKSWRKKLKSTHIFQVTGVMQQILPKLGDLNNNVIMHFDFVGQ